MNLNELNQLRLDMIEAKKSFDSSAIQYAIENCGYKKGDVIEVNGYSFRGKMMTVRSFSLKFDNWKSQYIAVLHGVVLKKDGTESLNQAETEIFLGVVK